MSVLLFANLKGGVAKTTNSVAIAETLATAGNRVLVIDADHQSAASELLLGEQRLLTCERRRATLHDLLAAMLDWDFDPGQFDTFAEYGASNIGGGLSNLTIIPCSLRIDDFTTNMARARRGYRSTEEFDSFLKRRRGMLRTWLLRNFDYTIVDCPPSVPLQVRTLLRVADGFIVPSIPDRLSIRGSIHLLERIRRTGIKIRAIGTLWTLYKSNNEIHRKVVDRTANQAHQLVNLPRPFKSVIPNATAIARACEAGRTYPSLAAKYEPPFARLYQQLCEEIITRLKAA